MVIRINDDYAVNVSGVFALEVDAWATVSVRTGPGEGWNLHQFVTGDGQDRARARELLSRLSTALEAGEAALDLRDFIPK